MVGASGDFSMKSRTRPSSSTLSTPSSRDWLLGHREAGDGQVGLALAVEGDHLGVIHLVDVVAGQDQGVARGGLLDRVDVLVDRVGGPLVPVVGDPLLGRDHLDVLVELAGEELPALVDVPVQADGLVLGEDQDLAEVGVDAVGEGEVDDPVDPAERDGRLGPVAGQGLQAGPPAPGQDDGQHVAMHPATSALTPGPGPAAVARAAIAGSPSRSCVIQTHQASEANARARGPCHSAPGSVTLPSKPPDVRPIRPPRPDRPPQESPP